MDLKIKKINFTYLLKNNNNKIQILIYILYYLIGIIIIFYYLLSNMSLDFEEYTANIFKKKINIENKQDNEDNNNDVDNKIDNNIEYDENINNILQFLSIELETIIKEATTRAINRLDWMPNFDIELLEVDNEELTNYIKNCEEHIECLEEAITELQGVLRNQYREERRDDENNKENDQ